MLRIVVLIQMAAACIAFSKGALMLHQSMTLGVRRRNGVLVNSEQQDMSSSPGKSSSHQQIIRDNPDSNQPPSENHLPHHLVSKLDIDPLLRHVSTFACTKRGKDSILSLLPSPNQSALDMFLSQKGGKPSLFGRSTQSRGGWYHNGYVKSSVSKASINTFPIAQSAREAASEYELVHQAMRVLRSQRLSVDRIPLPPMFSLQDTESTTSSPDTDDDEWIGACLNPLPLGSDILEEIDFYMILQAEQVTKLLLKTYEWSADEQILSSVPALSNIVVNCMQQSGDEDDDRTDTVLSSLTQLYETLNGAIEISQEGSNSYQLQLSSQNGRFDNLDKLRQREKESLQRLNKTGTGSIDKAQANKLTAIRDEIAILESQIQRTLIAAMTRSAPDVDLAFNALARLDVIFAKASFGLEWNGAIPEISEEGRINVHNFVHPVLAIEKKFEKDNGSKPTPIVPIDLLLPGDDSYQALMISGPNAGGKTLALKSFGVVTVMVKLALPITLATVQNNSPVVVDFFQGIEVDIGDNQSLLSGESTLMARLNSLSALIEKSSVDDNCKYRHLLMLNCVAFR